MEYFNKSKLFHKASFKKTSYGILIPVIVLMSVICFSPLTALAGTSENVGSFADFESALANVDNGGEIVITNNIEMFGIVSIPGGKELTIRSATSPHYALERAAGFRGSFFSVPDTSTVSFNNIVLDGKGYNATQPLIENGGTLYLNAGTMLKNNYKYAPAYVGGGVYNSGTLKIADGAAISNCYAGSYGGGGVQNEGHFKMTGGNITGNKGEGAVQNAGEATFTMTGGTITGNMDPYGDEFGAGAGVHHYGSVFNVSGNVKISTNNVNLNDRIIRITAALNGVIAIYPPIGATDGTVIATGDGYTLQESDKTVFTVDGFNLLLEDNNIVLQTPSPTNPPEPDVSVTGVTLDKESAEIYVGDTLQLHATIIPSDAANKNVTWLSSSPEIAGVDANGKVTGVKAGTATITVTTDDGGHTDTCEIKVLEQVGNGITPSPTIPTEPDTLVPVTGVTFYKENAEIYVGDTLQLHAAIIPSDASNKNVTWLSSAPEIAKVDANGKVTGIESGTSIITVITDDGGHTDTCRITVLGTVPPKTGDDNNLSSWVTMGLISVLAGFYLLYMRLRRSSRCLK